jgi:hypothetical protein
MRPPHVIILAALLLGGTASSSAALAAPAETATPAAVLEDYVVEEGDTCTRIALERFGDAKRVDVVHRYNHLGPRPHHLKPGQVLRLPAPAGAEGPEAELTFVSKHVDTFTPDRKPGVPGEKLSRGHKVATDDKAAAVLAFPGASRFELGENTLIVLLGQRRAVAVPGVLPETSLLAGALRAHLAAGTDAQAGAIAKIRTDAAEVELHEGEAKVSVDATKSTRLAIYRGRSLLRAQQRTVEVPEGFAAAVKLGESPGEPRRLPAAPGWVAEPPAALAVLQTADLSGTYDAGPDGPAPAAFRVQLTRDEAFRDLVVDVRVSATVKTLAAQGLAPGIYFARVSAIDADDFEGPFGKVTTTVVSLQPPEPPPPPPPPPPPEPTPPTAPVPPPRPPRRLLTGVGLLAGPGLTTNSIVGPRVALEVEEAYAVTGELTLALGLRGGWESYDGATTDSDTVFVNRNAFGGSIVLSARYRLEQASGLTPSLGVVTEMNWVRLRYDGMPDVTTWFPSVGPLLGVSVPSGPGAVAFEGFFRTPAAYHARSNSPLASYGLLGGYRMHF